MDRPAPTELDIAVTNAFTNIKLLCHRHPIGTELNAFYN
jgi:hypothetical protein